MNDAARQRFAAELERLKCNYLLRLRDSRAELEELWPACRDRDGDATARVHALAHGLAGTAGSYGLMAISEAATDVDVLCRDGAGGADIAAAVQLLIGALATELG